jgi:hypothetical protein
LRWSCDFCPLLFVCAILFIELYMLDHPCIPGMKLSWRWHMIFLVCGWIQFSRILLRIFVSMFIKYIGL